MIRKILPRFAYVPALFLLGVAAGCASPQSSADTNTSWVKVCKADSSCASGKCVNGVCAPSEAPPAPATGIADSRPEWDVGLGAPDTQGGPPAIRWLGDHFAVSWIGLDAVGPGWHVALVTLDQDGGFTRAMAPYQSPDGEGTVIDENGRVAVDSYATYGTGCDAQVFDADLTRLGRVEVGCTSNIAIAPLGNGQWAVAHGTMSGSDEQTVLVDRLDLSSTEPLSGGVMVGTMHSDYHVGLFTSGDRALATLPADRDSTIGAVDGLGTPNGGSVARVRVAGSGYGRYGFGELAGHSLLFGTDGASLSLVELAEGASSVRFAPLAPTRIVARPVGVAPAEARGVVGVCYATGPGQSSGSNNEDGVAFIAVDAEGRVVEGPSPVVGGISNIGGCDIAWSGEEFVVAYWRIDTTNTNPPSVSSEVHAKRIALKR